jgi:hypothetical protein
MAMTDAIPMTIPKAVNMERIRLRLISLSASQKALNSMGDILFDLTVAKMDDP